MCLWLKWFLFIVQGVLNFHLTGNEVMTMLDEVAKVHLGNWRNKAEVRKSIPDCRRKPGGLVVQLP